MVCLVLLVFHSIQSLQYVAPHTGSIRDEAVMSHDGGFVANLIKLPQIFV